MAVGLVVAVCIAVAVAIALVSSFDRPPRSDLATVERMVQAGEVDHLDLTGTILTATSESGQLLQVEGVGPDEFQALLDAAPRPDLRPSATVNTGDIGFGLAVGYGVRTVLQASVLMVALFLVWLATRRYVRPRLGRG